MRPLKFVLLIAGDTRVALDTAFARSIKSVTSVVNEKILTLWLPPVQVHLLTMMNAGGIFDDH